MKDTSKTSLRRGHNEGNIRQRTDGRWEVRLSAGIDYKTGKPRRTSTCCNTRQEAIAILQQQAHEVRTQGWRDPMSVTLGEWYEYWLETYMKDTIKQSTYASYRSYLNKHFCVLGKILLKKLEPHTLQEFYNYKFREEGLSPKTLRNYHMALHNWYQAKTQYIDNFVLTARSNEPEPVAVDKTALQKAIDANTCKVETDYTAETWADFAKALADANAVLADENATQTQVDAAAKALTDAAAALKVKPTEEPKPTVETKVVTDDLSDNNIPDSLKNVGYDTPEKITEKLKLESSKKLSSDNIVVYEVRLQVSTDGINWVDATAEDFPKNGLEISFTLPNGITAETAAQYDFVVSHMKDSGEVELLTPALKDGKLVVTVSSLSPFGISWKLKEQPKPSEEPKPTQAPTATPAPTAAPAASDASSNSGNSSGTTSAPASTAAPKATAAPTAPAAVIPQTADSFPLVLLAILALCSAAALTGLVICRKKEH